MTNTIVTLQQASMGSLLFIAFALLLWMAKGFQQSRVKVETGVTWGCAYTGGDPATHQYTGTSYGQNYVDLIRPVINVQKHYELLAVHEIFPEPRKFETHSSDHSEKYLISKPIDLLTRSMERGAVFQTGKLQNYVLYSLIFMIVVFLLTVFQFV